MQLSIALCRRCDRLPGHAACGPGWPTSGARQTRPEERRVRPRLQRLERDAGGGDAAFKVSYRKADAAERTRIEAQWKNLVEKATAMQDKLIAAAEKAFAEAPNADPKDHGLLVGLVDDWDQRDDYEKALDLGKFLMDHGCKDKQLPELAGVAAFAVGEFEAAESFFRQAASQRQAGRDRASRTWPKSTITRRPGRRRRRSARRRPRPTICPACC